MVCHVSQFIDKDPATSPSHDVPAFGFSAGAFHQDAGFNAMNAGSVVVWLALDDADESNGCMVAIPASHLYGLAPCALEKKPPPLRPVDSGGHNVVLGSLPPQLLSAKAVPLCARAGQVIVLSDLLMHSSPRNPNPMRSRPGVL